MDTFYFNFIVLPLGIMVGVLVASVYYFVNKRDATRRKTKRLIQAYIKERAKNGGALNEELAKLNRFLENKLIDEEKYARLKRVLVKLDEKKHEKSETKDLIDYVTSNK